MKRERKENRREFSEAHARRATSRCEVEGRKTREAILEMHLLVAEADFLFDQEEPAAVVAADPDVGAAVAAGDVLVVVGFVHGEDVVDEDEIVGQATDCLFFDF